MPNGQTQSVLVVDDDASIGRELCDALMLRNIASVYAGNLLEARDILQKKPEIQIVFMDYHLAGITGPEVVETLSNEIPRTLAFIIMTGDETQSAAIDAMRVSAVDFLKKPLDGRSVMEAVRRASGTLEKVSKQSLAAHRDPVCESFLIERIRRKSPLCAVSSLADILGNRAMLNECHKAFEYAPVELGTVVKRLILAMDEMSADRNILVKVRIPNSLPFLYADPAAIAFTIRDTATWIVRQLKHGDALFISVIREGRQLILNFRIASRSLSRKDFLVLTDSRSQISCPSTVQGGSDTLLAARLIVELHGGHFRFDEQVGGNMHVRIVLPLTRSADNSNADPIVLYG